MNRRFLLLRFFLWVSVLAWGSYWAHTAPYICPASRVLLIA